MVMIVAQGHTLVLPGFLSVPQEMSHSYNCN